MNQYVAFYRVGSEDVDYPIVARTLPEARDQAQQIADDQGLKLLRVQADS